MRDVTESYPHVLLPAHDPQGADIMAAIAKRSYHIMPDGRCVPADEQDPLVTVDQYYDGKDPVSASCLFESDYVPFKPFTDVVVIGKAHAPAGTAARRVDVSLSIGNVTKTIAVFGSRRCAFSNGQTLFSEPEPFTEMEIRFENAYGGVDLVSYGADGAMIYPRNHIGKGFVVRASHEAIEGLELPNLEDPQRLLAPETLAFERMEEWQNQPMPQGLGWYGKLWYPRSSFAGVMPAYMQLHDQIQEALLGTVPEEHVELFKRFKLPMLDFRFFNGAVPGLALRYLQGGEVLRLTGMDPRGPVAVELPAPDLRIGIDLGDGPQFPEVVLHTVAVLKEENRLYLVWRAALPYGGQAQLDRITRMKTVIEEA
jgi:hypothetical protein